MKTWLVSITAVAVLAVVALAQDDAVKKEYERFRGTWKFVSLEVEGVKLPPEQFKDARLVCEGERCTMTTGTVTYKGTFTMNVTTKPKQIDILFTDGPEKGNKALGIYELDGDVYKICLGLTGKERPKEFVSKPGSGHVLEVLHREKR